MIERLPQYYRNSKTVNDLYSVVQKLLDKINADIASENLKLFITTATDFTLHNKDVGLTEIQADDETKRARVIARIRGSSVLTKSDLRELIGVYEKAGCSITEHFPEYRVTVLFDGEKGKPNNFAEIQEAVEEVKPAHIEVKYSFINNSWRDAHEKLGTWKNTAGLTWAELRLYRRGYNAGKHTL